MLHVRREDAASMCITAYPKTLDVVDAGQRALGFPLLHVRMRMRMRVQVWCSKCVETGSYSGGQGRGTLAAGWLSACGHSQHRVAAPRCLSDARRCPPERALSRPRGRPGAPRASGFSTGLSQARLKPAPSDAPGHSPAPQLHPWTTPRSASGPATHRPAVPVHLSSATSPGSPPRTCASSCACGNIQHIGPNEICSKTNASLHVLARLGRAVRTSPCFVSNLPPHCLFTRPAETSTHVTRTSNPRQPDPVLGRRKGRSRSAETGEQLVADGLMGVRRRGEGTARKGKGKGKGKGSGNRNGRGDDQPTMTRVKGMGAMADAR